MVGSKRKIEFLATECENGSSKYLKVESFIPMERPNKDHDSVLIRDCYLDINGRILTQIKEWSIKKKRNALEIVVSGNPGIGKSRALLHLLHVIKTTEQSLYKKLLLNCRNDYRIYDEGTACFVVVRKEDYMLDESIIRLVEGRSDSLVGWTGASIVFASPGIPDLSQFIKLAKVIYYMPTWSREELINAAELNNLGLSNDTIDERLTIVGAIPGYVFHENFVKCRSELQRAVQSDNVCEILKYVRNKTPVEENHYSHRVLQMIPTFPDYENFTLDFISDFVANELLKRLWDSKHEEMVNILHDINGNVGETFKGRIYEYMCHKFLIAGNVMGTARHMPASAKSGSLAPMPLHISGVKEWTWFDSIDELAGLCGDLPMYFRPRSRIFAAVDGLYWSGKAGKRLVLLQMTISRSHPIVSFQITFLLQALSAAYETPPAFVFIVPLQIEKTSYKTAEPYLGKMRRVLKTAPKLDGMQQYVYALDPTVRRNTTIFAWFDNLFG